MTDAARSRTIPAQQSDTPRTIPGWLSGLRRRLIPTFDPFERLFYGGLILAAIGLAMIAPALAFLIPGLAISTIAVILKLRSP